LLGILKAGAGYLPLDPAQPRERLAFMLDDARPVWVVTQSALLDDLPVDDVPVLLLDDERLVVESSDDPEVALQPEHLAYVIYTSGSTGRPKGVMVEHRQLQQLFGGTESLFDFGDDDVWTLFHSAAFDFSVWELWGALIHGGRLLVVPLSIARAPAEFYRLLVDEGVTVLNQTPSAFRALIAAQAEAGEAKPHRLRTVIFGGEALDLHTLAPWFERNGERTALVNMYGITETTVHASHRLITAEDVRQGRGSLIGRPLPHVQLHVLDGRGEPVPIGVIGELYVGGGGVARGYLNRDQLTAERFVEDRYAGGSARLYRSGDLARWLPDGTLEYLGRNDFQVKIRGFRIELGEIEARLAACAGVRDAVVLAREDAGEKRLVAYVVASDPEAVVIADWRAQLTRDLADYMVPSAFVVLDALPLTANGKLDRGALPPPDQTACAVGSFAPPEGELEVEIAAIWTSLLGIERVGRNDEFFELGGHSLSAARLLSELRAKFLLDVSIRDVFEKTTVAALAAYVAERRQLDALHDHIVMDVENDNDQELIEL
jgi:amino acid adenylation domain-containing protein